MVTQVFAGCQGILVTVDSRDIQDFADCRGTPDFVDALGTQGFVAYPATAVTADFRVTPDSAVFQATVASAAYQDIVVLVPLALGHQDSAVIAVSVDCRATLVIAVYPAIAVIVDSVVTQGFLDSLGTVDSLRQVQVHRDTRVTVVFRVIQVIVDYQGIRVTAVYLVTLVIAV